MRWPVAVMALVVISVVYAEGVTASPPPGVAAAKAELEATGSLAVWVIDSTTHAPLQNAEVRLREERLGGFTDSTGWVRLERIPPGLRVLTARLIGWTEVRKNLNVRAVADTETLLLRFKMQGMKPVYPDTSHNRHESSRSHP
jgi:hypothetical protein